RRQGAIAYQLPEGGVAEPGNLAGDGDRNCDRAFGIDRAVTRYGGQSWHVAPLCSMAPTRSNAVRLSDPIASPAERSHVPSPRPAASTHLPGRAPSRAGRKSASAWTGPVRLAEQIGGSKISDHPRTYKANRSEMESNLGSVV